MHQRNLGSLHLWTLVVSTVWASAATAMPLNPGDIVASDSSSAQEIVKIDPATGARTSLVNFSPSTPTAVLAEPTGTLLIGFFTPPSTFASSILRFDPSSGMLTDPLAGAYSGIAYHLSFDSFGRLLVAAPFSSPNSIHRIDLATSGVSTLSAGGDLDSGDPVALAEEAGGTILALVTGSPTSIVRVDPSNGGQTVVSTGGLLTFARGITLANDGDIFVGQSDEVLEIDPSTGAQSILSQGNLLETLPGGMTTDAQGAILVASSLSFPGIEYIVRVDPVTGDQLAVSTGPNADPFFGGLSVVPDFSCPASPTSGCTTAAKSRVQFKTNSSGLKPKLKWKWTGGTATVGDFGQPETATALALCVYLDGARIFDASIGAGGTCDGRPCWKATGSVGFKFKSRDGNDDGVTKVKLREGTGKAKIQVQAGRDNLSLPTMPLAFASELRVQLIRGDDPTCWESSFSSFQRNDATQFKAKAP